MVVGGAGGLPEGWRHVPSPPEATRSSTCHGHTLVRRMDGGVLWRYLDGGLIPAEVLGAYGRRTAGTRQLHGSKVPLCPPPLM